MAKDDFIDLLDFSAEEDKNTEDTEGTLATIIKERELAVDDNTMLVSEHKVIESESFILRLYKKDDVIDSIEIECRCGRTARVQLDYGQSPDDTPPESGEVPRHEAEPVGDFSPAESTGEFTGFQSDNVEENEEFQNGIAAEVISADSENKIIDTSSDDSVDEENEDTDK